MSFCIILCFCDAFLFMLHSWVLNCCMSHSDELPSANALSALQHHLSGTLSLSPFRTVTRLHYSDLDLKHICSPPSMLINCPVHQRLWSHGNMALYKFSIVLYCIATFSDGPKKRSHELVAIILSNRNRFSKLFHGKIPRQICGKHDINNPTAPCKCCHTMSEYKRSERSYKVVYGC